MTNLKDYLNDGADPQSKAVLAFIRDYNIEESWDSDIMRYKADIKVGRWENCREQGYVISLLSENIKQINIAFFEHRNSDSICAVKWEQITINSPTIDTAKFGDVYKTKYDTSFSVGYGEIAEMSTWIKDELNEFWTSNINKNKLKN